MKGIDRANALYLGYSVPEKNTKKALNKYILNRKRLNRLIHGSGGDEKEE